MGMSMTPDDYLLGFVLGNWRDFQKNQGSVRHAFNAVVAASHMADHYYGYCCQRNPSWWKEKYPHLKDYRKHVSDCTDGASEDIRSIADAYKHLYPTREGCSIASTGDIEVIPISRAGVRTVCQDDAGGTPPCAVVRYTTKAGQKKDLLPVLEKVIEYWETQMGEPASVRHQV